MDKSTVKKLQPHATCEGALYRLYSVREELSLTKKENKILLAAKQFGCKNQTFVRLKELTEITQSGTYAPLEILLAVQENLDEIYKLAGKKRIKTGAAKGKCEISGKERKMHIEKDLKIPERSFGSALEYLYLMKNFVFGTAKQKRILHTATKGQNKRTFSRLKALTKQDKAGNYTPYNIKTALYENKEELNNIAQGRRIKRSYSSEDKKKLPLTTDYEYPTKTSKSIWTVKKK